MKRARKREKKRGKAEPLAEVPASVRRYWDRYERNQRNLLQAVKTHMPELKDWASTNIESMWGYEDGIYRFYHHSFKVEGLKGPVKQAIDLFHGIRPGKLNPDYEAIARAGTTEDARRSDIVAAFLAMEKAREKEKAR